MMKHAFVLLAAALSAGGASLPATATPITRTFTGTLTFTDGGPVTATTFGFGFTFDTATGLSNREVDYFTTSTNYAAFDASSVYTYQASPGFVIDGAGGGGLYYSKPDFFIVINGDPSTAGGASFSAAGYTVGDGSTLHRASLGTLVETTAATAVPETATWGLMIAGFGLVGYAMRRRRYRLTVRFA